jgi:hypothetical protein
MRCTSRHELEQLGAAVNERTIEEPIDCSGISVGEIQTLFREAERFVIKYETEDITGQVGLFAGLLTFGIGSVVAIVNTNIKMSALRREFGVDTECFKTSVFRLYKVGYRIVSTSDDFFRLERVGEYYSGTML